MKIDRAISLAIENVAIEGLTDIFPRPFEVDLLKSEPFRKELHRKTKAAIEGHTLDSLKIHPIQHVLFPKKGPFDFRRAALIQPQDTITFLALVLTIADVIEKNRIIRSKKRVFSYRFRPKNGYLFDPQYNFTSFRHEVSRKK